MAAPSQRVEREPPERPPVWRWQVRLLALLAGSLVAILLLELGALSAIRPLTGRSYRELGIERSRVAARSEGAAAAAIGAPRADAGLEETVIHPYLGYVNDPASNQRLGRVVLEVDEDGFFRALGGGAPGPEESFHVGIFGGSVAMFFCFHARQTLEGELAPVLAGRSLRVSCYGLGGYKQPQQLLTLGLAIARGSRFDVVLNLDGFNEVTLGWLENYRSGAAAWYPRSWPQLVADAVSGEALMVLARIQQIESARRRWSETLSRPLLSRSAAGRLLWSALHRRAARRLGALDEALRSTLGGAGGFRSHGPFEPGKTRDEVQREQVELWRRSSRAMHDLVTAHDGFYVHALQPNQWDTGSKPMAAEERRLALDASSPYAALARAGYPLLRSAGAGLRDEGVEFLDLSGAFREVQEPLYIDSCCHFRPAGSELLARDLAAVLRARLAPASSTGAAPSPALSAPPAASR